MRIFIFLIGLAFFVDIIYLNSFILSTAAASLIISYCRPFIANSVSKIVVFFFLHYLTFLFFNLFTNINTFDATRNHIIFLFFYFIKHELSMHMAISLLSFYNGIIIHKIYNLFTFFINTLDCLYITLIIVDHFSVRGNNFIFWNFVLTRRWGVLGHNLFRKKNTGLLMLVENSLVLFIIANIMSCQYGTSL